ncbi:thioesterase II family protein [Paenibacillus methanolicus]|uniref:Surfactin synthase thioesterase subunit n=1 Tax=Paenibacillus methanolicus TaxID=582686 RepID=A0A5S5CIG1_9BACL|nr:alpha/beta fold hydrolase [Paenibacillus methanolicus]TYP79314.1 surfactin synthase thioesterase subunit [Paenibacillus methanolicus]
MKLICLPYAGASAVIYMKWRRTLGPDFGCVPLELAGRGVRAGEPFYEDMAEAAEDIAARLVQESGGEPYAVFGHSMGAMILFEALRLIRDRGLPRPAAIFFSGRPAPDLAPPEEPIHELPDDAFESRILGMGATSPELFASEGLRKVFMPILRADFRLVAAYRYVEREPLPWAFAVLAGAEEKWTDAEMAGWRRHTTKNCVIVRMPGGHFYWQQGEGATALPALLRRELQQAEWLEMSRVQDSRG